MDLLGDLRAAGSAAGLVGFGVCAADPFAAVRSDLEQRVAEGSAGRLRFTFGDPATSTDVTRSFPWARRLVVGAFAYLPVASDPGAAAPGTGRVARFAVEDFYPRLRAGLERVAGVLVERGHRAEILIDDNRLVDRAAAVRAGVGWWGKNSMVLAPKYGPWLLLGSVVTDAELPVSTPMRRDCGSCTACIPACPTGAIVAPGVLDASRCLAHWAQVGGSIPLEFREAMGDRVYGCDDCLDACPPGHRLLEEARTLAPRGRVDLARLLGASDRRLLREFGHFYIPGRRPRYLRRNALVALGNGRDQRTVGIAAGFLGHRDPLLRGHAAWALGRLGGARAQAALSARESREVDSNVRREIVWAIEAADG